MEWLDQIITRPVVIGLAFAGGVLTVVGNEAVARRLRLPARHARLIVRTGYVLMWSSITLFIVAGFRAA